MAYLDVVYIYLVFLFLASDSGSESSDTSSDAGASSESNNTRYIKILKVINIITYLSNNTGFITCMSLIYILNSDICKLQDRVLQGRLIASQSLTLRTISFMVAFWYIKFM